MKNRANDEDILFSPASSNLNFQVEVTLTFLCKNQLVRNTSNDQIDTIFDK